MGTYSLVSVGAEKYQPDDPEGQDGGIGGAVGLGQEHVGRSVAPLLRRDAGADPD